MRRNLTVLEQPPRFNAKTQGSDDSVLSTPRQSGPISGHIDGCLKLNKGQRDFLVLYEASRSARDSHVSGSANPLINAVFALQNKMLESRSNGLEKFENFPPRVQNRFVDGRQSSKNLHGLHK